MATAVMASVPAVVLTVSLRVASLLLRFCCGLWSREDRGRSCQLGVEQEQQRFVVRERHPVGLPGVTPNLCGESDVVARLGDESAVAGERLVHDALATQARNGRLESGKITPRPVAKSLRRDRFWRRLRPSPTPSRPCG